jgi:2-oxoglutarate dehydrogenase E1 component
MRILSDPNAPADKDVKRLVLCSGKVAYDLMEARDAAGDRPRPSSVSNKFIPSPANRCEASQAQMTNLEDVVWAQEEPKNAGSWFFVEPFIEECLIAAKGQAAACALCRAARPQPRRQPA